MKNNKFGFSNDSYNKLKNNLKIKIINSIKNISNEASKSHKDRRQNNLPL